MTAPVQKLTPVNEPITFTPFQFLNAEGWGIILTKFEATEDSSAFYVPHVLLWLRNGDGVTPVVLPTNNITEGTPENAIIAVFAAAEPIFGDKINPNADIINESGEKIDTIYVVDVILEHEAKFKQFMEQMNGESSDEPAKVLH